HQPGIDHQIGARAQSFPGLANQRHVGRGIAAHGVPSELYRGESLIPVALGEIACFARRRSKQGTGVATDLAMKPSAKKLPDWQSESLALDVPEGHVDAAHGVESDAAASAIDIAAVHLVPDLLGFERIFTDDESGEAGRRGMRERPLDDAL